MIGYISFFLLIFISYKVSRNTKELRMLCLLIVLIFASIRYGIGSDYGMYYDLASFYGYKSQREVEYIPSLLLLLASKTNPLLFFFCTSLFIYGSIIYCISKSVDNKNKLGFLLNFIFFITFPYFFFTSLSIIRQYMAFSIIFIIIVKKERLNMFYIIILLVIACLCHTSAIIGILVLLPFQKLSRAALACCILLSFVVSQLATNFIMSINSDLPFVNLAKGYIALADTYQGGRFIRLLVLGYSLLALLFYNKLIKKNRVNSYYISLTCIGCCFQFILSVSPHMAMRICTLFLLSGIMFFYSLIQVLKVKKIAVLMTLLLLFSMYVYTQHITDPIRLSGEPKTYSSAYPYRTIFSK